VGAVAAPLANPHVIVGPVRGTPANDVDVIQEHSVFPSRKPSVSNRAYARIVFAIALGAFSTAAALAQQPTSTWQQIKQRGELCIGVTPGEPWYFKDPATGQWSGIGYRGVTPVTRVDGRTIASGELG